MASAPHASAALGLGLALPFAFAPFAYWPLAILLPAAAILLLRRIDDLRRVGLLGWLFGCGYFGFGVHWIYHSLHDFGMASPLIAGTITAMLVAVLALFPALAFVCWRYAERALGPRGLWLLPLFWFAFEWLRGWILTGLPWLSLGYAFDQSPLAGYAPLVGVFGIGAVAMVLAIALYLLLYERRYSMLLLLVLAPALGFGLKQIEWTDPDGAALDVVLVQGNIPQEIKWRRDQRQNIFNTYWRETSAHWGADLIVWPETALPGTSKQIDRPVLEPMQREAIEQGSVIISGLIYEQSNPRRLYNSAILLGKSRVLYHKRHLVMFGEYYPMRGLLDLFEDLISIPYSDLTPGPDEQPLMRVGDTQIGLSICFEDVFSREILRALPEANLLVNLSNDAWFGDSSAPHQHMQIARMRAIETWRPMIRATNTGISAIIDHRGGTLAQSRQFVTESIGASVQGRSGSTPFLFFARVQSLLAVIFLIGPLSMARLVDKRTKMFYSTRRVLIVSPSAIAPRRIREQSGY